MAGLKTFLQGGFSGCLETGKYHMEQFVASMEITMRNITYKYNKITYNKGKLNPLQARCGPGGG